MDIVHNYWKKYRQIILYGLVGICTMAVNVLSYYVLFHILPFSLAVSTVGAWCIACLFAFVNNKCLVFSSRNWEKAYLIDEFCSFFVCRLLTCIVDVIII